MGKGDFGFKKQDVEGALKSHNLKVLKEKMPRYKALGTILKGACTTEYPHVLKRCYTFAESFDDMVKPTQELIDWADKQPWAKEQAQPSVPPGYIRLP